MLRLKMAIDECGIQQKELVETTGFGKTQVSLTLNTGKMPANADKFIHGVDTLVNRHTSLQEWLIHNNMGFTELFQEAYEISADEPIPYELNPALNPLESALYEIAGRAALALDGNPNNTTIVRMAQAFLHLRQRHAQMIGFDSPFVVRTESEAAAILKGVAP